VNLTTTGVVERGGGVWPRLVMDPLCNCWNLLGIDSGLQTRANSSVGAQVRLPGRLQPLIMVKSTADVVPESLVA
jgi:hypothetical protein